MSKEWSYLDTAELFRVFCQTIVAGWEERQAFARLVGEDVRAKRCRYYEGMESVLARDDDSDYDGDDLEEYLIDDTSIDSGADSSY